MSSAETDSEERGLPRSEDSIAPRPGPQRPEARLVEIPLHRDRRGALAVLEEESEIPFEVRRVFYIFDVPAGETRASHAVTEVDELIVALSGQFEVLIADSSARQHFSLNRPDQGLFIPGHAWRELSGFSPGAVCLVLASKRYEPSDYARPDADRDAD